MIHNKHVTAIITVCTLFVLHNNTSTKTPEEHFLEHCVPLLCKEECEGMLETYKKATHDTQELEKISSRINLIAIQKRSTPYGLLDIDCEEYLIPLIEQAQNIIEDSLADVSKTTIVRAAVTANCPRFIQWLLDHGASPHTTGENGTQVLAIAAALNASSAMQVLLHNGAEVDHRNNDGHSALGLAALNGNTAIVKILENYLKKQTEQPGTTVETNNSNSL